MSNETTYQAFNWTRGQRFHYGADVVQAVERAAVLVGDEVAVFRKGETRAFITHIVTTLNPLSTRIA